MSELSLSLNIVIFAACAFIVAIAGTRMARLADRLADLTGLGEALFGAVFLGAVTSLSGSVTSVTAAAGGAASLAVSNAVGGIAAQTAFLVIADAAYPKTNLEHAAASSENMLQAVLLIVLLSLPLTAALTPNYAVAGISPVTPIILFTYLYGLRLSRAMREDPMWHPRKTRETRLDEPDEDEDSRSSTIWLMVEFAGLGVLLGLTGWAIAETGSAISAATGLSQTIMGAAFTAIATSLPELVTTIAAVRQGALTLAVGGIVGGNTFDVLFLVASDVAYRDGSIYHAVDNRDLFLFVWAILMVGALVLGLVRRERHGFAGIGFEGVALLTIFAAGLGMQVLLG